MCSGVIPRRGLVSTFVTLASRIYKRGQGPPQNRRSLGHSTSKAIQTIQDVGCYAPCGPNQSKSCVPCTFEFLISASPHPKLTTLGISLGEQPVKHRQKRHMNILDHMPANVPFALCNLVVDDWSELIILFPFSYKRNVKSL
jgi:hypothetical protein